MLSLSYLISTMNKENIKFLDAMNIKDNAVIINQTNQDSTEEINRNGKVLKFISSKDRGLSKSRNLAIKNCTSDICVIADDDFYYYDNSTEIILNAYDNFKDADVIAFYFEDHGLHNKKYDNKLKRINYLTSMKISSAQITFKRESIVKNNINFNENFGAGSGKYNCGEENIFLIQCLKKKLKIYMVPKYILKINNRQEGSTWFNGYNQKYFNTKGACYYEMSNLFYWVIILQFAIRRRYLFKNEISFLRTLKYMFEGAQKYKMEKKEYERISKCNNTNI